MMNANFTLLTFPPDMEINPNPTGFHDMLIGMGATFYNQLISGLKLNITLVEATVLGGCAYDPGNDTASCDGIVGLLASGAADVSLLPMGMLSYDPRIKDIPVRFGPELYEAGWIFASLPYEGAHRKGITVSHTFTEIPLFYSLSLIFYMIAFFVINYSAQRQKFLRRVTLMQMYGVSLMKSAVSVMRAHRRLIYFLCLWLSMMTYQFLMGSTNSDMVIVIPPKYYDTYQEIAASNETPTLIAGLTVDDDFKKSVDDRHKQIIFRRAIARGTRFSAGSEGVWTTIASKIKETVQFFDNEMEARSTIGISCFQNDFQPPPGLKFSEAFGHSVAIIVYSQHITPDLRKHVSLFYQKNVECGIYDTYQKDVRLSLSALGNMDRLTFCMMRFMNHQLQDSHVYPSNIGYYEDFLLFCSGMIMSSVCVVLLEIMSRKRKRKHRKGKNFKAAE